MISAKGLQVGNWLQCLRDGELKYFKITSYDFGAIEKGYVKHWEGIPLTPEILEKAGFVNSINEDEDDMFIKNYIRLDYMEFSTAEDNGFYYDNGSPNETKISFVHQLQNLYFALTGIELEITL